MGCRQSEIITQGEQQVFKSNIEGDSDQKTFLYMNEEFQILDFLGSGHFSEVFKVKRKNDQKEFALKILKQSDSKNDFFNEYNILKQFNNEYITKLEGILELDDKYCFIIEYASQGTLESFVNYLKSQNQLNAIHLLDFVSNIYQGLEALHSKNIIHRDLKIDNLLVHNYKVKISDLGVSTELKNQYAQTQIGNMLTQPLEQLSKYKEQVDIFAAGIISCQLLFNIPFVRLMGMKYNNQIEEIMNAPEKLQNYLLKNTNQDPKQRYTASESFHITQQLKYDKDVVQYIESFINAKLILIKQESENSKQSQQKTAESSVSEQEQIENTLFEIGMHQIKQQQFKESLITFKQMQVMNPNSEKAKTGLLLLNSYISVDEKKDEKNDDKNDEKKANKNHKSQKSESQFEQNHNQTQLFTSKVNQTQFQSDKDDQQSNKNLKDLDNEPKITNKIVKTILKKQETYVYNCPEFEDKEAKTLGPKQFVSTGSVYIGQWKNGKRSGRGKQIWKDGQIYEGYWKNNLTNGKGRIIYSDGDQYDGLWVNDKRHGKGIYNNFDGTIYMGNWVNDQKQGYGVETWTDGAKYLGQYYDNQKQGKGKFIWVDGSIYEGEFYLNKMHGNGQYQWADGKTYVGEWQEGKMHGKGIFTSPDGRTYIGEYKNDKKDGVGEQTWSDGRKYKGQWKEGKQHGIGYYFDQDGNKIKGEWENGKIIRQIED